ncbi:MAG TPA: class I SAM-dependent methyltransferase [Candidatus Dormibacteraeota bacterium]|nr:class I SAM-dependent methyltransferase [Candidatus Dormibacteraeota bacterium]
MADTWPEEASHDFITYGEFFVPDREEHAAAVCAAIPEDIGTGVVLDLCCGAGGLSASILESHPDVRVVGLDGSQAMRAAATDALARFGDRFKAEEFDLGEGGWRVRWNGCRAIVSSLAVHHLDAGGKQDLFRGIEPMLAPGGLFALVDVIQPASDASRRIAAAAWDEQVRARSLERLGDLSAFEAFQRMRWNCYADDAEDDPLDKPSTIIEQLTWLVQAGFEGVDLLFARAGHAVMVGYGASPIP